MRISKGRGWLAVVALALGTAQGNFVNFTTTDFTMNYNAAEPAILLFTSARAREFRWTASDVLIEEVRLFTISDDQAQEIEVGYGESTGEEEPAVVGDIQKPSPATSAPVSHPTFPSGGLGGAVGSEAPVSNDIGRRDPQNINVPPPRAQLLVDSTGTGGHVRFGNIDVVEEGRMFWFQAKWANGYSYSRRFTLFRQFEGAGYDRAVAAEQTYFDPTPYRAEETFPDPVLNDQIPDTTDGAPSQNTDGGSGNGGKLATPEDSSGDSSEDSAEDAGGGLVQGAIIGIAVGCSVAGLLVIIALVWYLLRRRQQKKALLPVDSAYSSANRADELMAEKEASADVDVSPHSPYSDDGASGGGGAGAGPSGGSGGAYQGGGEAVATGAAGAASSFSSRQHLQDPPRSFTPYSDRPSAAGAIGGAGAGTPSVRAASLAQTDEARVSVPSPIPGRATPRALTTPYAHLVEEGMTEDEIRRLEEEERQLDAAIEQAGRR